MKTLHSKGLVLDLTQPVVMGIVNTTPDSFSDGGHFFGVEQACAHAEQLISEGAKIIDIGGESTRPGAPLVSVEQELARVIPVIEYISRRHNVWLSIDTSKPEVMAGAVAAGCHLINDVRALTEPGALAMAAQLQVPVCLMHMQGQPQTMQANPSYDDLIKEVTEFFKARITACVSAGISLDNIILDPGFGFGKTLAHNYQLLANLSKFTSLQLPLLIGLSRKSMIGQLLGREVDQRVSGSVSAALLACQQGANIIRVHDVAPTIDMLKVWQMTQAHGQHG
ncbi:dihydropteroate synthase [Shewanella sp. NIFS-20-20]|uniref:dihydropteroate synthase n=1 Tax=Shewanella sp. NIFS-20-20 TaxID=2853806 RepID=UPI001C44A409|nr:dihydropteroate synthase [Shewanella sp. NIFS-20-20]MBV7315491.1 dihydropteroate synthase [Shewanella sp. NIFS-20-20]